MNSSCKEDILLAMHMVKHHTGIQSPVVIIWWIQRRTESNNHIVFHKDCVRVLKQLEGKSEDIYIYHSELE